MSSRREGIREHHLPDVYLPPEDWIEVPVSELASIRTGSRNTQDRVKDGEFPFFVRSQTVERINTYGFDCEAVLTAGDGVGTGKIFHYVNGKFDVHQRVYVMSDFSERVTARYFYLAFSQGFYDRIMSMTAKSSVDSVRREMIADMNLLLPPTIEEQEAIAAALSDVDALIASLDALIAKKRDIKQAVMQELLTGRRRLPGFQAPWTNSRLNKLGSFSKGKGIRKDQATSGSIPCVRYGELYTVHQDVVHNFYSRVSPEVAAESKKVRAGDILFAGSGETKEEIGNCAAVIEDRDIYAGGDIVIFSPQASDSRFLGYPLNTAPVRKQKASKGQGDAVVHISASALGAIEIQIPPTLEEQRKVAEILSDVDDEILALEARSTKTSLLKAGMMQELLSGRIRLI